MDDVIALRQLVLSDTFERLYASAVAWGRGDAAPPVFIAPEETPFQRGYKLGFRAALKNVIAMADAADEAETAPLAG